MGLGLTAGLVTALAVTPLGYRLFAALGGPLWPVWPLSMHPAQTGEHAGAAWFLTASWIFFALGQER